VTRDECQRKIVGWRLTLVAGTGRLRRAAVCDHFRAADTCRNGTRCDMITFHCADCGHEMQVKDDLAGKKAYCPKCERIGQIPASTPAEPPRGEVSVETGVVKFYCPKCGQKIGVRTAGTAKQTRCPKCGESVPVPGVHSSVLSQATAERKPPSHAIEQGSKPDRKPKATDDPVQALMAMAEPELLEESGPEARKSPPSPPIVIALPIGLGRAMPPDASEHHASAQQANGLVPCPICAELIRAGAKKCRFCGGWQGNQPRPRP
jgi:predicted RNA-binding Zn-ribbon protein involved in translation (DUF1610 family)